MRICVYNVRFLTLFISVQQARIALAEQLAKSRELTAKLRVHKDSSDEEGENEGKEATIEDTDKSNPWTSEAQNEVQAFNSSYRKFWNEKNKQIQQQETNEGESTEFQKAVVISSSNLNSSINRSKGSDIKEKSVNKSYERIHISSPPNTDESSPVETNPEPSIFEKSNILSEDQNHKENSIDIEMNSKNNSVSDSKCNSVNKNKNNELHKRLLKLNETGNAAEQLCLNVSGEANVFRSTELDKDPPNYKTIKLLSKSGSWIVSEKVFNSSVSVQQARIELAEKLVKSAELTTKLNEHKDSSDVGENIEKEVTFKDTNYDNVSLSKENTKHSQKGKKKKKKRKHILAKNEAEKSAVLLKPVNINDIFDEMEDKVRAAFEGKASILKQQLASLIVDEETAEENDENRNKENPSLEMNKQNLTADVDEELEENSGNTQGQKTTLDRLTKVVTTSVGTADKTTSQSDDIDPNKFFSVNPKQLKSKLPDLITEGEDALDDEEQTENDHLLTISEAFADDDVVDAFR